MKKFKKLTEGIVLFLVVPVLLMEDLTEHERTLVEA